MTTPDDMLLKVDGVSKSFRGLKALTRVSLEVKHREIVGLIGPNGAGKTTLFNLISGFFQPDEGRVTFDGHDLAGMKPHRICKLGLSRTFQIVKPFGNLTVMENVAVGAFNQTKRADEAEDQAWSILKFIGLEHKALLPAKSLTTPDRKRLELGRALATGPKLILLDEVMAGLNPAEKSVVIELVKKVRDSGVAVLVIEHAMRVIMGLSDRISVLNYGQCIATGDTRAVCSDPRVIEAYIGKTHASLERQ
jgi:branched-chain amino acid transport system ATP-binding protein